MLKKLVSKIGVEPRRILKKLLIYHRMIIKTSVTNEGLFSYQINQLYPDYLPSLKLTLINFQITKIQKRLSYMKLCKYIINVIKTSKDFVFDVNEKKYFAF